MNRPAHFMIGLLCVGVLVGGCARAKMQDNAAKVAAAVGELREDVDSQQRIRTELARSGVERLARGEAELAAQKASRTANQPRVREGIEPLLLHSQAVREGADPRFVPTIASEVERRETSVEYRHRVDDLEALRALLERLAVGSIRGEIELYLQVGGAAAEAAKTKWTEAHE